MSDTPPADVPFVDLRRQYHDLSTEIDDATRRVFSRASFILGDEVRCFEDEFASLCKVDHCVGVSSGTDALQLILRGLGVGPGDEVITAANTFIATVMAIQLTGARPVIVDCLPDTYLIDPAAVEAAVTPRTRALMPVHLYGQPADMQTLRQIADRHGLALVEDAAQAHGAVHQSGQTCGALGDAAAFSFYPSKNLGAHGDAGAVVTTNADLAERIRKLRGYGASTKHHHEVPGLNARLDGIQAAILRVKLPHLMDWNRARREAAARYDELLADVPGLELPRLAPWTRDHVFHLYVLRVPGLTNRDALLAALRERGIQTGVHYPIPVHLQPACADLGYGPGSFPIAEETAGEIFSLPMFPELSAAQIERVAKAVRECLAAHA